MKPTHVISLGHACPSAFALSRNGLRNASYPFDWVISEEDTIKMCIEDNFSLFLDRNQYYHKGREKCLDPKTKSFCHHQALGENYFRHHCPLCFDDHYAYYKRCVERFREAIKNLSNNILFVWMKISCQHERPDVQKTIVNDILVSLSETLEKEVLASWHLLIIDCYEAAKFRKMTIEEQTNRYTWVDIECPSVNLGVQFAETIDNDMVSGVLAWFGGVKQKKIKETDSGTSRMWPFYHWQDSKYKKMMKRLICCS